MKRKKRASAVGMVALLAMVSLTACGYANGPGGSAPSSGKTAAAEPPKSAWAEKVGLNKTETVDELYAKAKEEGKVAIYSMSGRTADVKKSFEAKYPGIKVEDYKLSSVDITEKISREHSAGVNNADVIFTKDTSGSFSMELAQKGVVHTYIPEDIRSKMIEPFKSQKFGFVPYVEARGIFYNSETYKTPPIANWWDLTTPEWKGRVMMSDPLKNSDTMDLFLAFVQNAEDMKTSYKEKFGKDIELNGSPNAGYEFLRRLIKNDLILQNSGGEIVGAIGKPNQAKPPVGIAVTSKLREGQEQGLKLGASYDMKPRVSHAEPALLFIADQAPHPNAAKLLIRWMAGEADGKADGFKPFNVSGSWPARTDIKPKDDITLEKLNLWKYDAEFDYDNLMKVREFWLKQQ
ncbi:ABC transporter substrate-binding protein [Paenibacillus thalictri]|uniref:ABC transporter substrate-binding protein n=1 Tax=Paenibacillus thalictri TaxID=2527873 RepID=UPI0013EF5451|nr:extracellular solute-binding protein [Paenibacillus thalictri]